MLTTTAAEATCGTGVIAIDEPTITLAVAGDTVSATNASGACVTVMVAVAVFEVVAKPAPEPIAVTVMTDVPTLTPVTTPVEDTLATAGVPLEKLVVTATLGAATSVVVMRLSVRPVNTWPSVGATVTKRSASGAVETVTAIVALLVVVLYPEPEPVAETVITAVPGDTPLMTPVGDTVATVGAELV